MRPRDFPAQAKVQADSVDVAATRPLAAMEAPESALREIDGDMVARVLEFAVPDSASRRNSTASLTTMVIRYPSIPQKKAA